MRWKKHVPRVRPCACWVSFRARAHGGLGGGHPRSGNVRALHPDPREDFVFWRWKMRMDDCFARHVTSVGGRSVRRFWGGGGSRKERLEEWQQREKNECLFAPRRWRLGTLAEHFFPIKSMRNSLRFN